MTMPRRRRPAALLAAALFGGGGLAGLGLTLSAGRVTAQQVAPAEPAATAFTPDERATLSSLEAAFVKIARSAGPATVYIKTDFTLPSGPSRAGDEDGELPLPPPFRGGPRRGSSSGSGVIVRAEGYILTNDHVVEDAEDGRVTVVLEDGTALPGRVSRDRQSDLAVVKVEAGRPLPFVRLADSDGVRVGQWVVAIGSPYGQQNSLSVGVVSGLHRKGAVGGGDRGRYFPNLLQTDAAINPGNSGGPLLNTKGELVGINSSMLTSVMGTAVGIGYAIPSNSAKPVLEQLITRGKVTRGYLGVEPRDLPAGLRASAGAGVGARLRSVWPDSPAEKGGLAAGDVVTRIGQRPVEGEVSFREAVASLPPGAQTTVAYLRGKEPRTASVTVGSAPANSEAGAAKPSLDVAAVPPGAPVKPLSDRLRVRVEPLVGKGGNGEVAELFASPHVRGVLIARASAADEEADLRPGDLITEVNGAPVASVTQFDSAAAAARSGEVVTLTVLRARPSEGRPLKMVVDLTLP